MPLSRWVTPPVLPRRFDARFFAAELPAGARVSFEGDEVAGHAWMTPEAALDVDGGRRPRDVDPDERHAAAAPGGRRRSTRSASGSRRAGSVEPRAEVVSPEVTRIVMPAGGGVPGQPIAVVPRRPSRFVLVDPGDPIGPGLELAISTARGAGRHASRRSP